MTRPLSLLVTHVPQGGRLVAPPGMPNFQRQGQDRFDNSRANAMLLQVNLPSVVHIYVLHVLKVLVGVSWTGATPSDRRRNKSQLVVVNWNVEFAFRHGSGSLNCPSGKPLLTSAVKDAIFFSIYAMLFL
jgi:hypothetical protein